MNQRHLGHAGQPWCGTDDTRNIVYVPVSFVAIKAGIDMNIIKPLIEAQKVREYRATPEYQGKSFVLIAIKIIASNPACGGGGRAARCAATAKDLNDDHGSAAARARRAMIGRGVRIG